MMKCRHFHDDTLTGDVYIVRGGGAGDAEDRAHAVHDVGSAKVVGVSAGTVVVPTTAALPAATAAIGGARAPELYATRVPVW